MSEKKAIKENTLAELNRLIASTRKAEKVLKYGELMSRMKTSRYWTNPKFKVQTSQKEMLMIQETGKTYLSVEIKFFLVRALVKPLQRDFKKRSFPEKVA